MYEIDTNVKKKKEKNRHCDKLGAEKRRKALKTRQKFIKMKNCKKHGKVHIKVKQGKRI